MKASEITKAAMDLVGGDRARTHGDKTANHEAIAAIWNGIMTAAGKPPRRPLDAHDVANLMEGMKIARRYTGSFNVDDYIDGSGYSAVAGEIKAEQIRRDQSWADAAVEGCPAGAPPEPAAFSQVCDAMRELLNMTSPNSTLRTAEAS